MNIQHQRKPIKMLIMYMITALLFLMFVDIHIHNHEDAVIADHGSAVSISLLDNVFFQDEAGNEINVSPDGMLKVKQTSADFIAVFLLIVMTTVLLLSFIGRIRENHILLSITHSYVIPPLRAPPL